MDLRRNIQSQKQIDQAAKVLSYQPFIISDDMQTGVAYSWLHSDDPRVSPPLLFTKGDGHDWDKVTDANRRLAAVYDDLLDAVAERFPGGSLIDIACNNGYFPVGAELRGMKAHGVDGNRRYGHSISFLNSVLGTKATFSRLLYHPETHKLRVWKRYDVAVVSEFMCHLPDPLNFLSTVGRVAKKGILFWGQLVDTDKFLISYQPRHPNLSKLTQFPVCFNDNTRLSVGLFKESMRLMGFNNIMEIPARDAWIPELLKPAESLDDELLRGSRHFAMLATR